MPFAQGGPVTDHAHDIGPGWLGLLRGLHIELMTIDPGYETAQVKEKFGRLVVYLVRGTEELWAVLGRYEALSAEVCETCGKPGVCKSGHPGGWIKTLCDPCRKAREDGR